MTIGASIFLIAVGAILAFAVNIDSSAIDLDVVGNILMIAGVIGLLIGLFLYANANRDRASLANQAPQPRNEPWQQR